MTWRETLLDVLCRIYKLWEGDCAEFGLECPKAIELVVEAYEQNGPPPIGSPAEKAAVLALLTELETDLALPANDLTTEENETLDKFIADMREDIG